MFRSLSCHSYVPRRHPKVYSPLIPTPMPMLVRWRRWLCLCQRARSAPPAPHSLGSPALPPSLSVVHVGQGESHNQRQGQKQDR